MKKMIALICLSAVVLAGCGKTENNENSGSEPAATTAAVTTKAESEETTAPAEETTAPAETVTETETAESTAAAAETTAANEANVSAGGRMDMYPAAYESEIRRVFDETSARNDGSASVDYAFRDLDADGIPELILKYGTCEADYQIHIYRYDEDCELRDLGVFGGGHTSFCYDENTGDFVIFWGHMGAASIIYYKWENGTLVSKDNYDFSLNDPTTSYEKVLDEKGIKYMETVSARASSLDGSVTSWVYHGDGSSEEFDGLYLKNIG